MATDAKNESEKNQDAVRELRQMHSWLEREVDQARLALAVLPQGALIAGQKAIMADALDHQKQATAQMKKIVTQLVDRGIITLPKQPVPQNPSTPTGVADPSEITAKPGSGG